MNAIYPLEVGHETLNKHLVVLKKFDRAKTPEINGRAWYTSMRRAPELPYEKMKFYNEAQYLNYAVDHCSQGKDQLSNGEGNMETLMQLNSTAYSQYSKPYTALSSQQREVPMTRRDFQKLQQSKEITDKVILNNRITFDNINKYQQRMSQQRQR